MQWRIVYEPENEFDIANLKAKRLVPDPKSLTEVMDSVRALLLRNRASKITITELREQDSI